MILKTLNLTGNEWFRALLSHVIWQHPSGIIHRKTNCTRNSVLFLFCISALQLRLDSTMSKSVYKRLLWIFRRMNCIRGWQPGTNRWLFWFPTDWRTTAAIISSVGASLTSTDELVTVIELCKNGESKKVDDWCCCVWCDRRNCLRPMSWKKLVSSASVQSTAKRIMAVVVFQGCMLRSYMNNSLLDAPVPPLIWAFTICAPG